MKPSTKNLIQPIPKPLNDLLSIIMLNTSVKLKCGTITNLLFTTSIVVTYFCLKHVKREMVLCHIVHVISLVLLLWTVCALGQAAELRVKSTHASMIESEVFSPISTVTSTLEEYHKKHIHKCIHHASHFDQDFVKRQIKQIIYHNMTLVNESRLNATLWLTKAAMHLPGGDFVEAG